MGKVQILLTISTIVSFLALSPNVFAAESQCRNVFVESGIKLKDLNINSLIELAKNDESIRSVDDLLAKLPPEFRSSFTLMRESRSAQKSSPSSPRVIMFSPIGNLVVGFNGDPSLRGFHSLEVYGLDQVTNLFQFRSISFKNDSFENQAILQPEETPKWLPEKVNMTEKEIDYFDQRVSISKSNPQFCTGCHKSGLDGLLKPHWMSLGGGWTGAYGSRDSFSDPFVDVSEEKSDFLKFKNNIHGRYSKLELKKDDPYFPYFESVAKLDKTTSLDSVMPNSRLMTLLSNSYAKNIVTLIKRDPKFASNRYALLYAIYRRFNVNDSEENETKPKNPSLDQLSPLLTNSQIEFIENDSKYFITAYFDKLLRPNLDAKLPMSNSAEDMRTSIFVLPHYGLLPIFQDQISTIVEAYLAKEIIESDVDLKKFFIFRTNIDYYIEPKPAVHDYNYAGYELINDLGTMRAFKAYIQKKIEMLD